MPQQASPRGTFLKIADSMKRQIEADPHMAELPSLAEVMSGGASYARARESTVARSISGLPRSSCLRDSK